MKEINNCSCGGIPELKSFQNNFYGFSISCQSCKKELFDKALPINHPLKNSITMLTQIQELLIDKWNSQNIKVENKT
jgi:uncharacterized ubiquitin-like protein YukD